MFALMFVAFIIYMIVAVWIKRLIFEDPEFRDKLAESRAKRIFVLIVALSWVISVPILIISGAFLILFEDIL